MVPYEEHLVYSAHVGCEVIGQSNIEQWSLLVQTFLQQSCTLDSMSKESYPSSAFSFFHPPVVHIDCCVTWFTWFAYTDSFCDRFMCSWGKWEKNHSHVSFLLASNKRIDISYSSLLLSLISILIFHWEISELWKEHMINMMTWMTVK